MSFLDGEGTGVDPTAANPAGGSNGEDNLGGNGTGGNPAPQQEPPAGAGNWNLDSKVGDILSDDLKNDNILSRYKDRTLKEYFQDTIETRKTMSSMMKVPPTDADYDTKKEYLYGVMDKLGLEKPPVTAGDYQFDMSSLPPGQTEDASLTEWARDAFHDAGLTNTQANALIKKWNEQAGQALAKTLEQQKKSYDETVNILKKEWGDKYEANVRAVSLTAQKVFPAPLIKKFEDMGLGNDPEFLRSILEFNQKFMSEHQVDPGLAGEATPGGGLTTLEKMRKILSDPNWKTDVSLQKEYQRLAGEYAKTHNKVVR